MVESESQESGRGEECTVTVQEDEWALLLNDFPAQHHNRNIRVRRWVLAAAPIAILWILGAVVVASDCQWVVASVSLHSSASVKKFASEFTIFFESHTGPHEEDGDDAEQEHRANKDKARIAETDTSQNGGMSIFVTALDDLLHAPSTTSSAMPTKTAPAPTSSATPTKTTPAPTSSAMPTKTTPPPPSIEPVPQNGSHGLVVLPSKAACADKGMFPINNKTFCEQAAKALGLNVTRGSVTHRGHRPEGCHVHSGKILWRFPSPSNKSHGSFTSSVHVQQQICMSRVRMHELHEMVKNETEQKAHMKKAEQSHTSSKELKPAAKALPNVSLYCFSLMMPYGYEPNLLNEQQQRKVGIFACNEAVVFSNMSTLISGEMSPIDVDVVEGSLAVPFGGKWMTALNTGVFNRIWSRVVQLGRYRYHDWVVKVDPDAVFFPSRLAQLLRHRTPFNDDKVIRHVKEPNHLQCGNCQLKGSEHETCASHVRAHQKNGHTCRKALELVSEAAPKGCGCECDDFACDLPGSSMYLNNCKWGLHGPIEVLSRRAVATYAAGLPQCVPLLENAWGEDKFLDKCLQQLGVERINEYSLLSEVACGEQPAPCGTSKVAFHPFKSIQSYFTCFEYADSYGSGPAEAPSLDIGSEEDAAMEDVIMK
mmetsp:Transcript_6490/g.18075  ORF Transcript_6490/g.18075 Transcript_6490/m.18075 type:complete len:651 (-) Transcript_6490:176-2128(-)